MRAVLAAVLLAVTVGDGRAESRPRAMLEEHVTARLVRVPVVLQGDCRDLRDGSIEIQEDGLPVGATYLDPDSPATAHAILIDAGPGMLDHLRTARQTATAYVRSLPANQPALLATFDHRMLLRAAWSTNHQHIEQGVGWIEVGAASQLWASTRKLIDYLRPRFGRKALILVTRGCDSEGQGGVSIADVIAAAERTESLSVFPVAVDMPVRCETTGIDPLPALLKLAQRTGGELFEASAGADLDVAFRAIAARLGREVFVSYAPPPFGAAPRDKPAKFTSRWRKLRVALRGKPSCSATIAGTPTRCESALGRDDCAAGQVGAEALTGPFEWSSGRDSMNGQVQDVVQDGGIVAPSLEALLDGSLPHAKLPQDRRQSRAVAVHVPALNDLLQAPGPEGVIAHMLARTASAPATAGAVLPAALPERWSDEQFLINGEVLAGLREPLGRALADHLDYRAWAVERARAERVAELDDLIRNVGEERRAPLEQARRVVAEGPIGLAPRELVNYLGAWLGDIPAARAFQLGEAILARQLLAAVRHAGGSQLPAAWATVERSWARFGRWVPPPDAVRLLAWLVPGYDPDEQIVGYYRVVLAHPFTVEMKDKLLNAADGDYLRTTGAPGQGSDLFDYLQSFNFSREAPLGSRLLRWMLEQDGVAPLLLKFDVQAVYYAHSSLHDLAPAMLRAGVIEGSRSVEARPARQVTLVMRPVGSNGPGLPIGAYFEPTPGPARGYDREPLCLVLFPERAANDAQVSELLRALAAAQRRTPCVL